MTRQHPSLVRSSGLPLMLVLAAGCDAGREAATVEPPDPPTASSVQAVVIPQGTVALAGGVGHRLRASVIAAPGTDTTVRWSGGDSTFAAVSPDGSVRTCWPGGVTIVTATSVADPSKSVTVPLTVAYPSPLWGLAKGAVRAGGDAPVRTDSIAGNVELLFEVTGGGIIQCRAFTAVTLRLVGAGRDTVLGTVTPETPFTDVRVLRFPLRANAVGADGARVLPPGGYLLSATFGLTDGLPAQTMPVGSVTILP